MKKHICMYLVPFLLIGCTTDTQNKMNQQTVSIPTHQDIENEPDGIYRGFYYDYGSEQVAVQFELKDNRFSSIDYRSLNYNETDYLNDSSTPNEKAVLKQFEELRDYLLGKETVSLDDLYTPNTFIEDIDAVSSATLPANTLVSAIKNGLTRGVYKPSNTTIFDWAKNIPDGTYRGFYYDKNLEQVSVHFTVKDGKFDTFTFRGLSYTDGNYLAEDATQKQKDVEAQFLDCADYLIGKEIMAMNDLYFPENITKDTDAVSAATLKTGKMISAINDAFNRGVYRSGENIYSVVDTCEDGIYRGFYYDSGLEQIAVQFTVKNNIFVSFSIRGLNYKDGTYLAKNATTVQKDIAQQFQECAEYLIGKNITSVTDLYYPENIASDMDAVTAATLRSSKMVSAINDAFSRGVYQKVVETQTKE